MKKVLFLIVPAVLVIIVFNLYDNKSQANNASGCSLSANEYTEVDKKDAVIIDVRTPNEYASGHLENAILINVNDRSFMEKIAKLDKNRKYFVYCKSGIRSSKAVNYMRSIGFTKVCNLEGGLNYLTRAGEKLVK